jgi:hypothetical protein
MGRGNISESIRRDVFSRDQGDCFHCGKKLCFDNRTSGLKGAWHIEHLKAHSKGGTDDIDNLRAACIKCNLSKNDKSIREWDGDDYTSRFDFVPLIFRCHGTTQKGTSCTFAVAEGNRKYCKRHE